MLFNLGSKQYGPEPAAMLSPAEKDKIFEEVIGKKIADEEFFETHLAKVIAQIYNEKHKQEPVLSPSCPDKAVEEVLAKEEAKEEDAKPEIPDKDAEKLAKEEAVWKAKEEAARKDAEKLAKEEAVWKAKEEAARKAKEEAARKAAEKAKEEAARKATEKNAKEEAAKKKSTGAKEKARAEILELVKKKDYQACEKHPGWKKYLSDRERWDVELVLKPGAKYKSRVIRNTVIEYVNSKVFNGEEITWELLKQTKEGITKIESNYRLGLHLMEGVR